MYSYLQCHKVTDYRIRQFQNIEKNRFVHDITLLVLFIYDFSESRCWQMWSYLHLDDSGVTFYCWCPDNCCLVWHTACCKISSPCVGEGEANLRCVCVIAVKWGVSVCVDLYHPPIWRMWYPCDSWACFLSNKESKAFITRSQVIACLVDGSLFRCLWASLNVLLQFVGRPWFYFSECVLFVRLRVCCSA